jgi:hypothetical protein
LIPTAGFAGAELKRRSTRDMEHEEIVSLLRSIHENAKKLAVCGEGNIEPRAAEIMAMSWAMLWAESPHETTGTLLDEE